MVTAQKRQQSLQDVPIAVSVIGEQALERNQFSDLRNLDTLNPSIQFQEGFSPVSTTFSMRGLGSYAFEGGIQPSVSFVVDGVPYARAGEFISELADIAQVEILRGPQGTIFGRNATAGAVNIVRNRPTMEFESSIEVGVTTDDENLIKAMVSGPLSDNVRGRLVGLYVDREGHVENLGAGGDAGGHETKAIVGKIDIDFSETVSLLLTGDYSDRTHGFTPQVTLVNDVPARLAALGNGDPARGQAILDDPFKTNFNKPGDKFENEAWGLTAELNWELSDGVTFTSVSAYREFEDRNNPDVDSTPADGDNLIMPIVSIWSSVGPNYDGAGSYKHTRAVDSEYFTQEFRATGTTENIEWIGGVFYQDYKESLLNEVPLLIVDSFVDPVGNGASLAAIGQPGTPIAGDEYLFVNDPLENSYTTEAWAVFGDATWFVTDRLNLFAGLRYTEEKTDIKLSNRRQLRLLSLAEIDSRFDSVTKILFADDIPITPAAADSVGSASDSAGEFSGRIGADYDITDDINAYATISTGFVGPGANMGRTSTLSTAFLDPTTAISYELGMKANLWEQRLRLDLAVFSQTTENLQLSTLIPGTTQTTALNAGKLEATGLEANVDALLTQRLTLTAGLSILDVELTEDVSQSCYFGQTAAQGCVSGSQNIKGHTPPNTPDYKYNVSLQYEIPTGNMPFEVYTLLNWVYTDEVTYDLKGDPMLVQEGYGLLDLTVGLKDREDRYELQLYGKNILDELYYSDMSEAFGALGRVFVRPSRNAQDFWGVRLKYNF